MVSAWDAFLIESGLVLKVASYVIVFAVGGWAGWSLKGALSTLPFETSSGYTGTSPVVTGGVKYKPTVAPGRR